ncbi:MAG: hypothetical protein GY761_11865 [Hyphomicrobiales bacterium]|nr:hypothetical protein [Hyphomicrobiales bacterium]
MKPFLILSVISSFAFGAGVFQANACNERIGVFSSPAGELSISVGDIQNAEVSEKGENATLTIYLHKEASEALESLTKRSINQRMTFAVCGEEIADPIVKGVISSGALSFYGLPADRIIKILNTMKGNSTCA